MKEWRVKGKGDPVKEVYETYTGDLYFITEHDEKTDKIFCFARLYMVPQFAEWGWNNINYLKKSYNGRIWKVPRKNWGNINSYEKGLLIKD